MNEAKMEYTLHQIIATLIDALNDAEYADKDEVESMEERADELVELLQDAKIDWCETFEDRAVLTNDNGLVIRTKDGSEFQITIVQSK